MNDLLRLKLDREVNVKEFLSFLDFHQFQYKTEEEEILNIQTMVNEKSFLVLIDENKLEEFKVLVLVYKDLLANKSLRHLNIPIENSLIDYENTRKINTIELVDGNSPSGDEIFSKANNGELLTEKDMENSFYGHAKKKKDAKKAEPIQLLLNKEDFIEEIPMIDNEEVQSNNGFIKDIFKTLGLLIFTGILVLVFILIR
ncbi:MAG: hypothetical protein FD141_1431 [Fusobacteria bacterium]|nr:MAG: hypothetical protein FD141_1431 [Fusobacteriota bacterium]KAF0230144.1 MAG: hypothetical protein FD182_534 [Fusobacteriota bacterium]